MIVEVVDASGEACRPGEIGQVLVTPLFNYATPLLRYELGDYAEVGEACACGRGLPVLRRILGRERNALLGTQTGERYWPAFGSRTFTEIAPIIQHQFVQRDLKSIEARFITERPLTTTEEANWRNTSCHVCRVRFSSALFTPTNSAKRRRQVRKFSFARPTVRQSLEARRCHAHELGAV